MNVDLTIDEKVSNIEKRIQFEIAHPYYIQTNLINSLFSDSLGEIKMENE